MVAHHAGDRGVPLAVQQRRDGAHRAAPEAHAADPPGRAQVVHRHLDVLHLGKQHRHASIQIDFLCGTCAAGLGGRTLCASGNWAVSAHAAGRARAALTSSAPSVTHCPSDRPLPWARRGRRSGQAGLHEPVRLPAVSACWPASSAAGGGEETRNSTCLSCMCHEPGNSTCLSCKCHEPGL